MRWWSIPIVAAVGWFLFTLTPFWTLYDLGRAVQSGDTAYVQKHVNFRALRLALVKQLSNALRNAALQSESKERQKLAEAATALALPLAEALITPQMVVDLLNDGWPQGLDVLNLKLDPVVPNDGLRVAGLGKLLDYYLASEMRGLRTVVLQVPPDKPAAQQFKLRMRLRDWSWHVIDIELTQELRERMATALARSFRPRREEGQPAQPTPQPPAAVPAEP